MAELDSEDSSDCALVIDEPNYDSDDIIEILDDTDSDVDIISLDDTDITSSLLKPSSSSTKINLICTFCSKRFCSNNDLLNHIRKFKGSGCLNKPTVKITKKKNTDDLKSKHLIRKKRGRPPKHCPIIEVPIPGAIPITVCPPPLCPIFFKPNPPPINDSSRGLPTVRQMLVHDIEPEYPCELCGQIFRHNIGLICHLNSEHISTNKVINKIENSPIDLSKKKRIRKTVIKENKQTENYEPVTDTIDLTTLPDFKKDTIMNRMKSYVFTANKNQVICVLCNLEFQNTKRALAHIEDKHITDKIECGYCNMKFVYELKLRSHMAKRHKVIAVYKCDKCSKMINKEECDSHLEKCKGKANPDQSKPKKKKI